MTVMTTVVVMPGGSLPLSGLMLYLFLLVTQYPTVSEEMLVNSKRETSFPPSLINSTYNR